MAYAIVRSSLNIQLILPIWNMNNDHPPTCKMENFVTMNCEISLSHWIQNTLANVIDIHSYLKPAEWWFDKQQEMMEKQSCTDIQREQQNWSYEQHTFMQIVNKPLICYYMYSFTSLLLHVCRNWQLIHVLRNTVHVQY